MHCLGAIAADATKQWHVMAWPLGQWHVIPGVMALDALEQLHQKPCGNTGMGQHVIHVHWCFDMQCLGAISCNALAHLRLIPCGNTMQCLGAVASNVFGQWQLMPWCNGRGCIYWVILHKSLIWGSVGQMTEKDPDDYLKKIPSYTGQLSNVMWSIIMRVFKNDFILSIRDLRTHGPFFYRSY